VSSASVADVEVEIGLREAGAGAREIVVNGGREAGADAAGVGLRVAVARVDDAGVGAGVGVVRMGTAVADVRAGAGTGERVGRAASGSRVEVLAMEERVRAASWDDEYGSSVSCGFQQCGGYLQYRGKSEAEKYASQCWVVSTQREEHGPAAGVGMEGAAMEGMPAENTTAEGATAELAAADRPEDIGSAREAEAKTASTVRMKSCMMMAGHARWCDSEIGGRWGMQSDDGRRGPSPHA
jgi:hypothetical protein